MSMQLTFEGKSRDDLEEQIRSFLDGRGGSQTAARPVDDPDGGQPHEFTNEDYRRAIRAIPRGKVAAYSVVSEVVRGHAGASQKVAGLAANDPTLETAYRVVKKDGGIAAGFRWHDGRMGGADEGRQVLEGEGVGFDQHGRVRAKYMLSVDELRQLYEDLRRAEEG
jgi:alkylated DNA nucleotide flippase Atl1